MLPAILARPGWLTPDGHGVVTAFAAERCGTFGLEALTPTGDRRHGRLTGPFRRELPARGTDLLAAVAPDRRRDPRVTEGRGEALDDGHRARGPRGVRDRVHRDEVDVGMIAAEQVGHGGRVEVRVVHATDHGRFVGDAAPRRACMVACGVHDLRDRPAAVQRDEHVAERVAGRMERDRQRELRAEGRQPADARDDPGGRDGDVPRAEAEPPRIVERLDRGEHSVEVEKRFTHAHEHDVGEPLAGLGEPSLRVTCLVDDLRDFQVAPEPEFAGGAERASHGTARLAGDAQGVSLPGSSSRRVVHQHRFDERTVREPMECLLRLAVVGEADLAVLDRVEAVSVGDGRPEAFGERSDRRGVRDAAVLPHGIGDLPSAIGRFAARFDPRRERIGRQTGDAGAGVAGHRTMLLPTMAGRPRR